MKKLFVIGDYVKCLKDDIREDRYLRYKGDIFICDESDIKYMGSWTDTYKLLTEKEIENYNSKTKHMSNTQKVPYEGMQAIFEIACPNWKNKIKKMTSLFEDTELTQAQVSEMFEAASEEQTKTLRKYLKEPGDIDKSVIQERLDKLVFPYTNKTLTKQQKSVNALVQMFVIAEVMNGGTELTWDDRTTYKYQPYKYWSVSRWVIVSCGCRDGADSPSGVCLKSSKLAIKAYEMFPQIYDDFYMIEDNN